MNGDVANGVTQAVSSGRATWMIGLAAWGIAMCGSASVQPVRAADPPAGGKYAIALHGGALDDVEGLSAERRAAMEQGLRRALETGRKVLAEGGTSLDAVEQVIRILEDDPHFNAGKGAVYNSVGGHELDASIMDGRRRACGAVAGVSTVKNPISLARRVMTETRHVLLLGAGAEKFADEMQVERVDNRYFDTDYQYQRWQERKKRSAAAAGGAKKGTVGCVALDRHGDLAAGTSTGGLTDKKFGRVGDSPIVGAGTYADNATCAVSCTGTGEQFIRHAVAYDISARLRYARQPLPQAVREVLEKTLEPEDGGLIALGADGTIVMDFNTVGMSRAAADSSGRFEVRLAR